MSIKIHHGAPGSYKTSGAMSDDIFPILQSGRLIITNVRGFTREQVLENFPEYDEQKININNIDTDQPENRLLMSKWFHWVPLGAFLLIDEAQMVFPKKWDKKYISALGYEGGEEKAYQDNRPHDWDTAWEKHRHYNWDFILTTPNIKKIRSDIRECSDGGFFHRDLGSVGLKGSYKESFHQAIDSPSASNIVSTSTKRVNKDVFKLYQSTATDEFLYTTAGIKIWKDPKLLLASCFLLYFVYSALSGFYNSSFYDSGDTIAVQTDKARVIEKPNTAQANTKIHRQNSRHDSNYVGARNRGQNVNTVNRSTKKDNKEEREQIKLSDFVPTISGIPASAPVYKDLWIPVSFPRLSCIASKSKCICHTQQSTPYKVAEHQCRKYALVGRFDFTIADKTTQSVAKNNVSEGVEISQRHSDMLDSRKASYSSLKDAPIANRFSL